MAQATVKTIQYIDPRIEPQPDPVYDYVIAPTQNQYYQIPTSGLSDSQINFNNLTTLGVDRAYLDTFEIELSAEFIFHRELAYNDSGYKHRPLVATDTMAKKMFPTPDSITFDSFPFNKCCSQAHVNINGGAFFSEPMSYVRAKERYMDQTRLARSYQNVCPWQKPILQTESGKNYSHGTTKDDSFFMHTPSQPIFETQFVPGDGGTHEAATITYVTDMKPSPAVPTRLGAGQFNTNMTSEGMYGGFNNDIIQRGAKITGGTIATKLGFENFYITDNGATQVMKVTWREPIFCSPFSSKYDATYGRPLYNITSMDLSFTMQALGNMIRVANLGWKPASDVFLASYDVHITSARLCYQVMTIPPVLNKPLTTLVPYRRFVPYISNYGNNLYSDAMSQSAEIPVNGASNITIRSGVYTLNEIPTAIWIFVAPVKDRYQTNEIDRDVSAANVTYNTGDDTNMLGNWDSNKLFAYIDKVNISLANTTQILDTAKKADLYRIAKANGCQDSFWSWAGYDTILPKIVGARGFEDGEYLPNPMYHGAGSVLRVKPGVDLIVPDQALIPGANANNMVFQCECNVTIPPHSYAQNNYALWLLFEYVGVAAISPGQCEITMNPLGSGEIMQVSPVMSATSDATEGEIDSIGGWEKVKKGATIAQQIAEEGVLSKILKHIPATAGVASFLEKHGLGEPAAKKGRDACGGAVMGKGLKEWVR